MMGKSLWLLMFRAEMRYDWMFLGTVALEEGRWCYRWK
jgi:hypothetical protein